MSIARLRLRIKYHAWQRYCDRVEPIEQQALYDSVQAAMHEPYRWDKRFVHLGGVWWRASIKHNCLTLHTCYGRTHIDIPQGVRWAKRSKDRIRLGGEVLCDGGADGKTEKVRG